MRKLKIHKGETPVVPSASTLYIRGTECGRWVHRDRVRYRWPRRGKEAGWCLQCLWRRKGV